MHYDQQSGIEHGGNLKVVWLHEKMGAFGGAEANVLASAQALRDRGFRNVLVCRERTCVDEDPWRGAFEEIHAGADAVEVVRAAAPDNVWIHNWPDSADFPRLAGCGVPLARMVHDHAMYCMRHYKYNPLTRRNCTRPASAACIFPCLAFLQRGHGALPVKFASLRSKLAEIADNKRLDCLVVASEFMRGELLKNGFDAAKIRILAPMPPGAPAAGVHPAEVSFVPGRILFTGQIIRGKGLDLLIRAVHGLAGDWHLCVAGAGSALAKCRDLVARLGLGGRITIHGYLGARQLAEQYGEAQVVAVPSAWQEPYGMVGVEAMRHARPVVGFGTGGIPEWLRDGENGLLVPPGDIGALRAALGRALGDPAACRRMGLRGLELAATDFSFSGYTVKLAQMLEDLAATKRPAAGPQGA